MMAAMVTALILSSMFVACGSEEAVVMEISGESKVQPIQHGGANIYLIETESGYILVDAGMPGQGEKLDEAFAELGVDPESVQLIIATHGHLDHIGSISHAQQVTGGSVLCHRSLAESLANSEMEQAVPQTKNLGVRVMNYLASRLSFTGAKPDIVMDDEFDLNDYGIAGKIIHTPGHSASSISIILDNGEALIGDLVRDEDTGEIGFGAFYEDKEVLLDSLERVAAYEPRIIYLSHGTYINNNTLKEVIEANR
jgi:glyoxylase-like metal-dependent hydrolase (beta-lactamase superfamily II)